MGIDQPKDCLLIIWIRRFVIIIPNGMEISPEITPIMNVWLPMIVLNWLFVNPIDIGDNNIPNGNSIYLLICSKLNNIANDKNWSKKLDILSKTFNTYISFNFSQMFSYLKVLDICEENITVTLHGRINQKIKNEILKKFMGNVSVINKESEEEFFVVLCKNQTCSEKLKNLDEVKNYLENKI